MDPAIVLFGLGIGVLVGMTGMGGGSLMTPLLILIFGIQPTTAIGTDIFYSAITKTVGGWRHFRMKTVNMGLVKWLAIGSVPAAVIGVAIVSVLEKQIGEEQLDSLVYAVLGGTLLMVGIITLARALILRNLVSERDDFEIERRHKVAAVVIGATTGFVIGITSAGSGTVIAILLIAVFRLAPKKVVGTDVFHAAILLWAAGIAHWIGGNVDFTLAANILIGSVPGVIIGAALSDRAPQGFIRTALGVVLVGSGIVTIQKGDPTVWPIAAGVAALGLGLILGRPPLAKPPPRARAPGTSRQRRAASGRPRRRGSRPAARPPGGVRRIRGPRGLPARGRRGGLRGRRSRLLAGAWRCRGTRSTRAGRTGRGRSAPRPHGRSRRS